MLKLNCGFNKKVGEANYGSRGASVALELELESGLIAEPDKLKQRIQQLFALAKESVEAELNGPAQVANGATTNGGGPANGNGHANNGNGHCRDGTRKATASQARALHAIADRHRVDLAGLLRQRFGVDTAGELTITEASALIDELKLPANVNGGRR